LLAVQEPLTVVIKVYYLDLDLDCRLFAASLRFLLQQVLVERDNTRQRPAGNPVKLLSKWHMKLLSHPDLAPTAVPD
jgi:hypothetical protein